MTTVGIRIQERMDSLGLKQVDLVKRTGISKSLISMYISGQTQPKQRNLFKLAKALNVNEAWLMGFDDNMDRSPSLPLPAPAPVLPAGLAFKLSRLDALDLSKVEAYADGLLEQDKYKVVSSAG